jgi:hypothetical protein
LAVAAHAPGPDEVSMLAVVAAEPLLDENWSVLRSEVRASVALPGFVELWRACILSIPDSEEREIDRLLT